MENAKAAIGTVELPTGIRVDNVVIKKITFREMAGPEEDILASSMKVSEKLNSVMTGCTQSIGDIVDRAQIKVLIKKLVESDRWFYLVQLRVLSLGSNYSFMSRCPACGVEEKMNYDLKQVQVKNPPSAEALFIETTVPSGKKIRWKIADGEVSEKIEKIANSTNAATVALFARATEVDGKPAMISDILELPLRDRSALRKEIESKEGEFDDEFDATCSKCGHTYKANLELEGASFFSL